jgi:CRISPR system Cascade subunit CasA
VLFVPGNLRELVNRIRTPISDSQFTQGIERFQDWFDLNHPDHPFMQIRGVKAKNPTPMDKLMPGLTGATNSCFVNEAGQADSLCGGCVAIALFNQAGNAPSFGGGFKAGLRGGAPITTLIQGRHLRETIWFNVLCTSRLETYFPDFKDNADDSPTWVAPIKAKSENTAASIGLLRGLFWQPAYIELCNPKDGIQCSCCGRSETPLYQGFMKAKFPYTIKGLWPHPHSPRLLTLKKGVTEEKFAAFTTNVPTWTHLSSFVVELQVNKNQKNGHQPAAVVDQARKIFEKMPEKLQLAIGGYRNNQASILERRHEIFELNRSWYQNPEQIREIVDLGLGYKTALRKGLFVFSKGIKDIKGVGVNVQDRGEFQFFRLTDNAMLKTLADANFANPLRLTIDKNNLRETLKQFCLQIFKEQTQPYLNDPMLIKTMAVARRTLNKSLQELEPEKGEGGEP